MAGLLAVLLGLWCGGLLGTGLPARGERPGMFLEAADIPRAKALAMDAALTQGWSIIDRGRTFAVFETRLDEPAMPGPPDETPPPFTLLRIRADFIRQPAGVKVYLFAQEVWFPHEKRQWTADVTPLYRPNLHGALQSLRARWDDFRQRTGRPLRDDELPLVRVQRNGDHEPATGDVDTHLPAVDDALGLTPLPADPLPADGVWGEEMGIDAGMVPPPPEETTADVAPVGPVDVGRWAYYAEQHAAQRGCNLGDLGAVLIDEDAVTEVHRVYCEDGKSLDIRCDSRSCALTY